MGFEKGKTSTSNDNIETVAKKGRELLGGQKENSK